ncbi:uncharacterized protein LOC118344715 [Juglans regia]|uniref:Uncharacterized protein LOC118344715 n=1 Tax=Juglans regia TaxID=51240 RepID=A0A6P9E146_JUGRE|nr:uncharacterized protein LOC118344715 [Juglans regia]
MAITTLSRPMVPPVSNRRSTLAPTSLFFAWSLSLVSTAHPHRFLIILAFPTAVSHHRRLQPRRSTTTSNPWTQQHLPHASFVVQPLRMVKILPLPKQRIIELHVMMTKSEGVAECTGAACVLQHARAALLVSVLDVKSVVSLIAAAKPASTLLGMRRLESPKALYFSFFIFFF